MNYPANLRQGNSPPPLNIVVIIYVKFLQLALSCNGKSSWIWILIRISTKSELFFFVSETGPKFRKNLSITS